MQDKVTPQETNVQIASFYVYVPSSIGAVPKAKKKLPSLLVFLEKPSSRPKVLTDRSSARCNKSCTALRTPADTHWWGNDDERSRSVNLPASLCYPSGLELGLQCQTIQDCLEDMLICIVIALFGGLKGNLFCLSLRWDLAVLPSCCQTPGLK